MDKGKERVQKGVTTMARGGAGGAGGGGGGGGGGVHMMNYTGARKRWSHDFV